MVKEVVSISIASSAFLKGLSRAQNPSYLFGQFLLLIDLGRTESPFYVFSMASTALSSTAQ